MKDFVSKLHSHYADYKLMALGLALEVGLVFMLPINKHINLTTKYCRYIVLDNILAMTVTIIN